MVFASEATPNRVPSKHTMLAEFPFAGGFTDTYKARFRFDTEQSRNQPFGIPGSSALHIPMWVVMCVCVVNYQTCNLVVAAYARVRVCGPCAIGL